MEEQTDIESGELVVVEEKRGRGRPKGSTKKTVDKRSFLKAGGHEYEKIIKKGERQMIEVMDAMAEIATSKDSTTTERIKAADIFATNFTRMVDQMNKDEVVRKEKEVVVNGVVGGGEVEDEEEDSSNLLDFDNIPEEFQDNKENS